MRTNIIGNRYSKLVVLKELPELNHLKQVVCQCRCDCGNIVNVVKGHLVSDHTKSCGCLIGQFHGESNGSRLYDIYSNMKDRCYNDHTSKYKDYGARGITICNEWLESYTKFRDWAVENGYQENLTLDRIDNDGNYEPSNCHWATRKQQAQNRRSSKKYTINGEVHCLKEWCEILNLNYSTVYNRIYRGCDIYKALEL